AMPEFVIEHILRFGVSARDRVADHYQVRLARQVLLGITGNHLNLSFRQKRGHRWIDILIRATDLKSSLLDGRRCRGHRRAAYSNKMDRFNQRKHLCHDRKQSFCEKSKWEKGVGDECISTPPPWGGPPVCRLAGPPAPC